MWDLKDVAKLTQYSQIPCWSWLHNRCTRVRRVGRTEFQLGGYFTQLCVQCLGYFSGVVVKFVEAALNALEGFACTEVSAGIMVLARFSSACPQVSVGYILFRTVCFLMFFGDQYVSFTVSLQQNLCPKAAQLV